MIDIITTRFREAYTWIIPPEHERHQKSKRDQHITSIKRFSDERHKKIRLGEELRDSHVIISTAPLLTSWITEPDCFIYFQKCNGNREIIKTDATTVLPSHGLFCQDCSKILNRVSFSMTSCSYFTSYIGCEKEFLRSH